MTQQYIEFIQAHMDGKKIEWRIKSAEDEWGRIYCPSWGFDRFEYRVAPEPKIPDTIEWEHVAPEFKFIARDEDSSAYLYMAFPSIDCDEWFSVRLDAVSASSFASYKRGTTDWTDSLVARPQP